MDPSQLISLLGLKTPITAIYSLESHYQLFPNAVEVEGCVFINEMGKHILKGTPLLFTPSLPKLCPGWKKIIFGADSIPREALIKTLCEFEILRPSIESANMWLNSAPYPSPPETGCIVLAPFQSLLIDHIRTISFWVNPDQLSALIAAANFYDISEPEPSITVSTWTNCMSMVSMPTGTGDIPRAVIGLIDPSKRFQIPDRSLVSLNCNLAMLQRLIKSAANPKSVLHKAFIAKLHQ